MPKSDEYVLEKWVRKQLENKESPDVLKIVLKNRGDDPKIVDSVTAMLKLEAEKKELAKKDAAKKAKKEKAKQKLEKQPIQKKKAAALTPKISKPEVHKDILPESRPTTQDTEKPKILSRIMNKLVDWLVFAASAVIYAVKSIIDCMPRIHIGLPNFGSVPITSRMLAMVGLALIILAVLLLVSYGLNEYADNLAKGVIE